MNQKSNSALITSHLCTLEWQTKHCKITRNHAVLMSLLMLLLLYKALRAAATKCKDRTSMTSWRHQLLCFPVSTDASQRLTHVTVPCRSWRHIGRQSTWKASKLYNHFIHKQSALKLVLHVLCLFVTAQVLASMTSWLNQLLCCPVSSLVSRNACHTSPCLVDRDVTSGGRAPGKAVSYTIMHKHFMPKRSALKHVLHVLGLFVTAQELASTTSWRHQLLCFPVSTDESQRLPHVHVAN